VNLEVDILAKHVERLLAAGRAPAEAPSPDSQRPADLALPSRTPARRPSSAGKTKAGRDRASKNG
jgi:hypothetical protein